MMQRIVRVRQKHEKAVPPSFTNAQLRRYIAMLMASSSRQDTASVRASNHPWLQVRRGSDEYKRLQKLLDKEFEASHSISWSLLRDVGEFTPARNMMNEPWSRFFAISGPQYKELCLEFFSTFNFNSNNHNYSDKDAISFVL